MRTGAYFFVCLLVLYMPAGLVLVCQPFFKKGGEVGVSASYHGSCCPSEVTKLRALGQRLAAAFLRNQISGRSYCIPREVKCIRLVGLNTYLPPNSSLPSY